MPNKDVYVSYSPQKTNIGTVDGDIQVGKNHLSKDLLINKSQKVTPQNSNRVSNTPKFFGDIQTVKWSSIGQTVIDKKEKLEERTRRRKASRKHEYKDKASYQKLQSSGRMRLDSFER